jgi:hypothetical protein
MLGLVVALASCGGIEDIDRFRACEGHECDEREGGAGAGDATLAESDGGVGGVDGGDAKTSVPVCSPQACKGTCCGDGCINLTADKNNCGACGHSCLGGECANGQCQPFVFASGAFPTGIALDETSVYWTEEDLSSGTRGVQRCDIANCNAQPTLLAYFRNWPTGIAVDATRVYWAEDYNIRSCSKTTCANLTTLLYGGNESTKPKLVQGAIAIDAENVYWIGANGLDAGTGGVVNRCAKSASSCTPTVLATLDAPGGVATDGVDVYVTASTSVVKCATTGCGGSPTVLAPGESNGPSSAALDKTNVYWTLWNGGVSTCAKSGCSAAPRSLVKSPLGRGYGAIALDDANVYWVVEEGGAVMSCPKMGCDTPTILASGLDHPRGIAVDAVSVFFTVAYPPGHVMRVAK